MTLYKLTTVDGKSKHGDLQWGPGVTHEIPPAEQNRTLCRAGLLHAYSDPNVALLQDPGDGDYGPALRLWRAEGDAVVLGPLKCGCHRLTTVEELPIPAWYADERTRLCVQLRYALECTQSVAGQPELTSVVEKVIGLLRRDEVQPEEWKQAEVEAAAAEAAAEAEAAETAAQAAWWATRAAAAVWWAAEAGPAGDALVHATWCATRAAEAVATAVEEDQVDFAALAAKAVDMAAGEEQP